MPMTPEEQAVVEAAVEWEDIDLTRGANLTEVAEVCRKLTRVVEALHAANGGRWTPPDER